MLSSGAYTFTIILAILVYVFQFSKIQSRKHEKMMLRFISSTVEDESQVNGLLPELPPSVYVMILDDEGKVVEHSKNKKIVGLNLKQNVYMEKSIKKIVSKAVTGGGYTKFMWGNGIDDITKHMAYSRRLDNKHTLCIIKNNFSKKKG